MIRSKHFIVVATKRIRSLPQTRRQQREGIGPFDSRENRIAMDDLPSQDTNFAGPAAPSATPERNLDAGMLETIQQVFGCSDVDRLPGALANGYERRIALPGTRTEALDVNRLSWPVERFRRVDHRVHQSRRTAGVDVRPFRLPPDERGDVELLSQAIVIKVDIRVGLECQEGDERRCLGAAEGVVQLDPLFEQSEMGAMGSNGVMPIPPATSKCLTACSAVGK